ncbi:hypothetical protein DRO58_04520 [Candidatus Bathyarchaeota archaeon]|nr:MAG: hypothetical protein DRO58_04520 [Candidatus Bathyarchaeota archaeon]
MPTLDEYVEGGKIAELAVKEGAGRNQLRNIALWASSKNVTAVRYFIDKQVSRGYLSLELAEYLKELLQKVDIPGFRRIMLIAYDYFPWKKGEHIARMLYANRDNILKVVRNYSSRQRLGKADVRIFFRKEGTVTLHVYFERDPYNRKRVAQELERLIKSQVPSVKALSFQVWIEKLERR